MTPSLPDSPQHPDPDRRPYVGYRPEDEDTSFAAFFRPDMAPLAEHAAQAVTYGAQSPEVLTPFEEAGRLLDDGYEATESGFALLPDGSSSVAIRTPMPGVTAAMWDWWFGWHGNDPRRYKLWHPRAHLWVRWGDGDDAGRTGRARWLGRTSFVDEYIGSTWMKATIRFVPPSELGLDEGQLAEGGDQTVVCARLGSSELPVEIGWLAHHVRPTDDGAEMRSRFWMGGPHVAATTDTPVVRSALPKVAARVAKPTTQSCTELLVHCSQEMAHLASILPELHARFGDE
jgi:hypothetical protein